MQDRISGRAQLMLVIGAGPAGLAIAKSLKQNGVAYEQLEAEGDLLARLIKLQDQMDLPMLLRREKRLRKKLKEVAATKSNPHWPRHANLDLYVY